MLLWQHLEALRALEARLRGSDVRWALTGSVSFAPQGLPVEIHDIDAQTDAAGAYALASRFAEAVIRPVAFHEAERIRSHFGAPRLYGVTVEIMGAVAKRLPDGRWEEPVEMEARTCFVEARGLRLPVDCRCWRWSTRLRRIARWGACRPRKCWNAGSPHSAPEGDAVTLVSG